MDDLLDIAPPRGRTVMRDRVMPGVHVETYAGGRPKRPAPEDLVDPGYEDWLCQKVAGALAGNGPEPERRWSVAELRREFAHVD